MRQYAIIIICYVCILFVVAVAYIYSLCESLISLDITNISSKLVRACSFFVCFVCGDDFCVVCIIIFCLFIESIGRLICSTPYWYFLIAINCCRCEAAGRHVY